jgi:multiple sugar transport system permease protein
MSVAEVTVPFVRRKLPSSVRRKRFLVAVANHSLLIAASIAFIAPFVFITLTALMTNNQALSARLWPHPFAWHNFTDVFTAAPIWRWALNTLEYSGLATLGLLLSSVPVAYALARLRWRGRNVAFMIVLIALMLPPQVSVVPLYVMWAKLHLVGTLWPVIIPNWFGDAFSIFLLRQFFMSIPEELTDAARVDGASDWGIMMRVIVPLAKPAIAAIALFNFLYNWNDFFGPLLYLIQEPKLWTLSVGLSQFKQLHAVQWNLTMAASTLFMLPVIVLFFLAQRVFIEGVTLTGVKG